MNPRRQTYLEIVEKQQAIIPQPTHNLEDAFVAGYIAGMRKSQNYDAALHTEPQYRMAKIAEAINGLPDYATRYYHKLHQRLDRTKNSASLSVGDMRTAFIWGYKTACHRLQQYDPVLFTKDEGAIINLIHTDLLAYEKAWKAARD